MSAEQKIRDLAYRLWQEGGGQEGRDLDYWLMAESQVTADAKPKAAKPKAPAKPKAAAKPKAPAKTKVAAKA